jgi:septal ring-binding cell division protein DamX
VKQPRELPFLKIWEQVKAKLLTPKRGASTARRKMMILVMPVLVVVLLLVVVNAIKKPASTKANPSKKASAAVAFNGKINWELPAVIPDNLRNPMAFGAVATGQNKETTSRPVVKGIVYSTDNPCAVVGDRIVSAGDTVGDAKVVKINPDSVEFAMGDKTWTQKVER